MKLSRNLTLFFVISVCFAALQIGCWQKNDKNPVAALPVSNFAANVAFKIVTPANKNASFSASIRPSAESQPFVIFELKLANFGNSLTPFSLVKKQAPVVNGSATVTFESLPNTTVVGSLQIENGNIDGFSNFHGAADLNQGSNIVELAPVGSLMPQDVLANAVSEIVSSSTLLLKAPATLATELAKIVSNLPLDSISVYDEVLNNFSNRTGLPLVELLAPANAQAFTIGSSINIIASATDLDGSISKIEFYQNSIKIGEKSSLPFSLEWQPSATGTYAVYAKAIDNNAAVGVTASISVVVIDAAPTHTVTYNGNGNTSGSVPTDNQSYQSGAIVTVADNTGNLTKTGYTFAGWNTAADGSGTSYNPAATFNMGATNVTLYAKWSLVPTYTVTYNGNGNTGGTVPADNQTYQQNATVTVADNTGNLTKTGYTFAGWNTAADGSGTNYNPAATFNMGTANITLYAKWSLVPTYTVTYNGNGNTGGTVPTDNQTYQQNATVTVAGNTGSLTKTGYTFAGWNTAADGSGTSYNPAATFNMGATNVTLYAKWQSSAYSWTPGNTTVSESNFAVGRPTAIYSGSSFSSPSAVDGNTMSRWESNRNDPGPDETNPHFLIVDLQQDREVRNIKVNISGWDSWKQNFSIFTSIDLQNWSLVASEQDKTGIFSYNLQPTSVRYVKFSSTYSADNGQVNLYELEVYGTEQVANTYSVTYNGNGNTGGTVPTDNQTYQQNATVTVADNTGNLTKTGYTFSGWNTAADGSGTNYNPAATFNMGTTNVTLYAKWSLVPTYTVTYNGNGNTGGTVPTDNQTYQQNATVTVADNTGSLTKTDYTFAGWNTAADGSGTSYNPAVTFNMSATNITLYAKWVLESKTTVGGIISADQIWFLASSPYEITSNIQIAAGITLTVEPGVVVRGGSIENWGILKSIGSADNKICFSSTSITGKSQSGSENFIILDYVLINDVPIDTWNGRGNVEITNCIFKNNYNTPIDNCLSLSFASGISKIEKNIFIEAGSITIGENSNLTFQNNVFYNSGPINSFASSFILTKNSFIQTESYNNKQLTLSNWWSSRMSAQNNYWQTTGTATIDDLIFDKNDDLGCIDYIYYSPVLSQPDPATPDPTPYL